MLVWFRPCAFACLPERRATRDLLVFSGGFVAASLFGFVASQGDNFVVGRSMTAEDLGVYGRAYQLMWMAAMFLGEVLDRVLFPILARSQADKGRLRHVYSHCVGLVATIMTPAATVGIALARRSCAWSSDQDGRASSSRSRS